LRGANVQKQTDVLVVCPDCRKVYLQRVTGGYIGPRKRAPNYSVSLQERCKAAGQTDGADSWYGLMRCTACSLRRCPPALRETLRSWLENGESPA
jgi:hypothetical protein